jgi:hypothetical protein
MGSKDSIFAIRLQVLKQVLNIFLNQLVSSVTLHKYFYEKETGVVFGVFCVAAGRFLPDGF